MNTHVEHHHSLRPGDVGFAAAAKKAAYDKVAEDDKRQEFRAQRAAAIKNERVKEYLRKSAKLGELNALHEQLEADLTHTQQALLTAPEGRKTEVVAGIKRLEARLAGARRAMGTIEDRLVAIEQEVGADALVSA